VADKKKKAVDLSGFKIFTFFLVGAALGLLISFFIFDKALETSVRNLKAGVDDAWTVTQLRLNKVVDQAIVLRKKYVDDKVKADYGMFDSVIDSRSRLLGTEDETEKAELIASIEKDYNRIIEYYNSRIDLRGKRFTYILWAYETQKIIEEYAEYMEAYRKEVDNFNIQIKRFPLDMMAKRNKFSAYPLPHECAFKEFETRTEKYIQRDLEDYRIMEKILYEKKEQKKEGAAAAEGQH
jgi:hypothetical protein